MAWGEKEVGDKSGCLHDKMRKGGEFSERACFDFLLGLR